MNDRTISLRDDRWGSDCQEYSDADQSERVRAELIKVVTLLLTSALQAAADETIRISRSLCITPADRMKRSSSVGTFPRVEQLDRCISDYSL